MRYITAVLAAFGLLLLGTMSAHADHSTNPNTKDLVHVATSHESECGSASVTLTVPEGTPDWNYRLQVEVDDEIVGSTDLVNGPGFSTLPLAFDEDQGGGSVVVKYYFLDAEEWDIVDEDMNEYLVSFKSFEVDTDCATVATPIEPTLTQPTCDEPEAKLTVPEVEGVAYEGNGDPTPGHTVTVIATPTDGYVFDGEQEVVYTFDIAAVPGCDGDPSEPGEDGKDGTGGEDAVVPTAIPAGEQLPKTGVSPMLAGLVGAGLLGTGGGLLAWQRRRMNSF